MNIGGQASHRLCKCITHEQTHLVLLQLKWLKMCEMTHRAHSHKPIQTISVAQILISLRQKPIGRPANAAMHISSESFNYCNRAAWRMACVQRIAVVSTQLICMQFITATSYRLDSLAVPSPVPRLCLCAATSTCPCSHLKPTTRHVIANN